MRLPKTNQGFTLIEILIVIIILGVVTSIVGLSFAKLNSKQALDKSTNLTAAILNEARSMTLSSIDASQYGVNLAASQVVLFKGSSYSVSDPNNMVTPLNSEVGIRSVTIAGGGTSVVFKRLTGRTDQTGTLEVYLLNEPSTFRTVTISATGIAETN